MKNTLAIYDRDTATQILSKCHIFRCFFFGSNHISFGRLKKLSCDLGGQKLRNCVWMFWFQTIRHSLRLKTMFRRHRFDIGLSYTVEKIQHTQIHLRPIYFESERWRTQCKSFWLRWVVNQSEIVIQQREFIVLLFSFISLFRLHPVLNVNSKSHQ